MNKGHRLWVSRVAAAGVVATLQDEMLAILLATESLLADAVPGASVINGDAVSSIRKALELADEISSVSGVGTHKVTAHAGAAFYRLFHLGPHTRFSRGDTLTLTHPHTGLRLKGEPSSSDTVWLKEELKLLTRSLTGSRVMSLLRTEHPLFRPISLAIQERFAKAEERVRKAEGVMSIQRAKYALLCELRSIALWGQALGWAEDQWIWAVK